MGFDQITYLRLYFDRKSNVLAIKLVHILTVWYICFSSIDTRTLKLNYLIYIKLLLNCNVFMEVFF